MQSNERRVAFGIPWCLDTMVSAGGERCPDGTLNASPRWSAPHSSALAALHTIFERIVKILNRVMPRKDMIMCAHTEHRCYEAVFQTAHGMSSPLA